MLVAERSDAASGLLQFNFRVVDPAFWWKQLTANDLQDLSGDADLPVVRQVAAAPKANLMVRLIACSGNHINSFRQ